MKKFLVLAASLMLAASPAAAQQSVSDAAPVVSAPVTASAASVDAQLFPTRDEVRQRVAATEATHAGDPVGSRGWWYTVAAVAVGVIIALLLLD